jgi:hypothetical protein
VGKGIRSDWAAGRAAGRNVATVLPLIFRATYDSSRVILTIDKNPSTERLRRFSRGVSRHSFWFVVFCDEMGLGGEGTGLRVVQL